MADISDKCADFTFENFAELTPAAVRAVIEKVHDNMQWQVAEGSLEAEALPETDSFFAYDFMEPASGEGDKTFELPEKPSTDKFFTTAKYKVRKAGKIHYYNREEDGDNVIFNSLAKFEEDYKAAWDIMNGFFPVGGIVDGLPIGDNKRAKAIRDILVAKDQKLNKLEDLAVVIESVDPEALGKRDPTTVAQNIRTAISDFSSVIEDKFSCPTTVKAAILVLYREGLIKIGGLENYKLIPKAGWADIQKASESTEAADALGETLLANAEASTKAAEDLADQIMFQSIEYKDQCILLSQIFDLAGLYKEKLGQTKALPYKKDSKNASLIVDGHPFGFINKLTQYPGNKEFFEMKNHEISNLQPLIRFFKVIGANKASDKIDKEIEISFDSYAKKDDIEDIFKPLPKRGFGVGIKNFSLTYDGNNPFAAKKSIRATLSIFANNFGELLKVREGRVVAPRTDESPRREKYRYIDLALKTGKSVAEKNPDLNELDFRLKAVFGYTPIESTLLRDEVRKALKNNFVSINLTPVTHNFEFDEMGRVTFNIEFFAFVEEFYDKPRMNIFADKETYLQILKRKLAFETLQKKDCDSAELVSKIKEAEVETINEEKKESLQFLMRQLSNKGKIYYLNLGSEQLKNIVAKGPYHDLGETPDSKVSSAGAWGSSGPPPMTETLNSNMGKAFESALEDWTVEDKERFMQSFRISGIDSVQIPFFYVGDLLDIIIGGVEKFLSDASGDLREKNLVYDSNFENKPLHIDPELAKIEADNFARSAEQFKKFRLLLGPLEIVNHKKLSKSANINFADLPIAVSYFMEWLTTKTLALSSAVYPLTQFLNDLFNDLIRNYLNDDTCYAFNIKQKVRLNQAVITSYKKGNTDEITEAIGKGVRLNLSQAGLPQPLLNISGHHSLDIGLPNPGMDKETNYFIFFAGRAQPQDLMEGDKKEDEGRGIFHYILGRDSGIVKNISLTKTNAPGLKEVRLEQEGYDGLTQLREIYDINIDCFANVQAFPGTYIFVDPRGFSPSLGAYDINTFDITDLGIGGYHMIITSEHNFGPGQANTTLRAKWVAALEKEDDEQMAESGVGSNDEMPKKCSVEPIDDVASSEPEDFSQEDDIALGPQPN